MFTYIKYEDLKLLDKLTSSSFMISNVYKRLCDIEINHNINSNEYKKELENLKIALDIEYKKYNKENISQNNAIAFLSIILNNLEKQLSSNEIAIHTLDFENKESRRVLNRLCDLLNENYYSKDFIAEEVLLFSNKLNEYNDNNSSIFKSLVLYNSLERDLLYNFVYYLNNVISKEKNIDNKNKFIKLKYFVTYLYSFLEKEMINKDFNINDLNTTSDLISGLLNIKYEDFNDFKIMYYEDIVYSNMITLVDIDDFSINKEYLSMMVSSCMIKSSLLNLDNETILKINNNFHELIDSDNYNKVCPNNSISEKIIISAFESINNERNKLNKLTYGLRK